MYTDEEIAQIDEVFRRQRHRGLRILGFVAGQLFVAAFFVGLYFLIGGDHPSTSFTFAAYPLVPLLWIADGVSHLAFAATIVLVPFILAAWIHARVRR